MANKNFDGMEQPSWYDGMIEDEGKIQQMILDEVMTCQSIGIAKKVIRKHCHLWKRWGFHPLRKIIYIKYQEDSSNEQQFVEQ